MPRKSVRVKYVSEEHVQRNKKSRAVVMLSKSLVTRLLILPTRFFAFFSSSFVFSFASLTSPAFGASGTFASEAVLATTVAVEPVTVLELVAAVAVEVAVVVRE